MMIAAVRTGEGDVPMLTGLILENFKAFIRTPARPDCPLDAYLWRE